MATIPSSALVIEGVCRSRNALLNGDTSNYDWDSGYTCHQLGSGAIVVQLGQPYALNSMRLLLWDCDERSYSYYIEVSCNQRDWEVVCDRSRENCKSWQTINFPMRPVVYIKIVGTHNTANEVFHCVHFECPAQTAENKEKNNRGGSSSGNAIPRSPSTSSTSSSSSSDDNSSNNAESALGAVGGAPSQAGAASVSECDRASSHQSSPASFVSSFQGANSTIPMGGSASSIGRRQLQWPAMDPGSPLHATSFLPGQVPPLRLRSGRSGGGSLNSGASPVREIPPLAPASEAQANNFVLEDHFRLDQLDLNARQGEQPEQQLNGQTEGGTAPAPEQPQQGLSAQNTGAVSRRPLDRGSGYAKKRQHPPEE